MKRYIDEFIKLKCAPDLLRHNLFPNGKEITESIGCFRAAIDFLTDEEINFDIHDINIIVVGDGVVPRTAAIFALRTAWNVISIDPVLRIKEYDIKRLELINKKVEDCNLFFNTPIIIILPHSHAQIKDVMNKIRTSKIRHIISLPCCVPHDIPDKPYIGYIDTNIWGPKNLIKIWRDV